MMLLIDGKSRCCIHKCVFYPCIISASSVNKLGGSSQKLADVAFLIFKNNFGKYWTHHTVSPHSTINELWLIEGVVCTYLH